MQIAPMEGPYGHWEGKDMGSLRIRSYTFLFSVLIHWLN